MQEEHRCSTKVEAELWHKHCAVGITACGVVLICAIGQSVCRVDTYTPLHVARELIHIVDRQI